MGDRHAPRKNRILKENMQKWICVRTNGRKGSMSYNFIKAVL